jgi:hypothetical protein
VGQARTGAELLAALNRYLDRTEFESVSENATLMREHPVLTGYGNAHIGQATVIGGQRFGCGRRAVRIVPGETGWGPVVAEWADPARRWQRLVQASSVLARAARRVCQPGPSGWIGEP